jgi:type III pantothenate kinase
MDINLLVLNVGNTRVAAAAFVAGELQRVTRVDLADPARIEQALHEAWHSIDGRENAEIAGASVNPGEASVIEELVQTLTGKKVQWVGQQIDLPIRVLTEQPEETGVDRVVNVAAAYEQLGKACIVVDAGSALSISCCNDKGELLGGAIAPGASMMLQALHDRTARLPQVDLATPQGVFGRSTREAILHGVFHGIRGMVKEIIENYATELGTWPEAIATGGDAPKLFEGWEVIHAISPDLTLYGIALAYANHHIKHGT